MPEKKAKTPKKSKGNPVAKAAPKVKPRVAIPTRPGTPTVEVLPEESKSAKSPALTKKLRPSVIDYDSLHKVEDSEDDETESDADADAEVDSESADESESTDLAPQAIDQAVATVGRAISATDPLKRYLEEVRRYPLLTPEEEVALATKLHETGDLDAAKRLVQANLRLVVKIAFEYKSVYANAMDLIQEGNIGLMKAVSKYDPSKGAKVG